MLARRQMLGANILGAQYIENPPGGKCWAAKGFYSSTWSRRQGITKPRPQIFKRTSWWEGEKRYWLHPASVVAGIAIDRSDGTIVGRQFEEVTE